MQNPSVLIWRSVTCSIRTGIADAVSGYTGDTFIDGIKLDGTRLWRIDLCRGMTGTAMQTVDYIPARGTVSSWGDSYGNRVDRFLAGPASLDGSRPSFVMARGYYTRTVIAAWDWRRGAFTGAGP